MKLYYTVASQQNDIQQKPSLSLGGYKAVNPVVNASIGNMFSDISMFTVKSGIAKHYIGLILVNDTGDDITDAQIHFTYPNDCVSIFRVAAVDLLTDAAGYKYMEHIPTNQSKPLYAEFIEANGRANVVSIGAIDNGDMIGIWIERELLLDTLKTQQNAIYEKDPNDPYKYLEVELNKLESVNMLFIWGADFIYTPSVSIAADVNPIATGQTITVTATPTNGGTTPSYQWYVNDLAVGTDNPVYAFIPNDGDVIYVEMTSNLTNTTHNPVVSETTIIIVTP